MSNDYLSWFLNKLPWVRRAQETNEIAVEHPAFSTNIFDECEGIQDSDDDDDVPNHQMFWFCVVIATFFLGVAISYYIIHH
jgi:hypothetical protein